MANVSSSNGLEKYPKLRFKDFSEPWKTDTLGNLGTFIKGAPLSKADITDEGTPFVLYGELYTTYGEVTRSIKRRTDKVVEPQFYSKVGDVIMPTSGETPEDIATASCIMLPDVILAGDLLIYRTQKVDGRLVSFVVKNKVNKQISSVAQGKSVVHVRAEELSKIAISYPSDAEQHKILTMLELLEDKMSNQRELIEHLKKYKRGAIERMINQLTGTCDFSKISSFATCVAGATPDTKKSEYWDNGTIPWLSSGEVNKKRIYFTDKHITALGYQKTSTKMLPVKTVVIALAGQGKTRGTVAITETEVCTNQSLAGIITNDTMNSEFLFYYLETQYENLRILSSGDGTRGGLNLQLINDFLVPTPSLDKQKFIAAFGTLLDKQINFNQDLLCQLQSLKSALLQQLFA